MTAEQRKRTLKIEQCNDNKWPVDSENLSIFRRNKTKNAYYKQSQASKQSRKGFLIKVWDVSPTIFLESLILAQDERWRRA